MLNFTARGRGVHRGLRASLVASAIAIAFTSAHASSAKFFQASTQTDFLKGDVENLSIDSRGQLSLGPATELVYETSAPFLWALLPMPDGSMFVGSGNEGKVFKIDPDGKGSLFFDSVELEVHALAAAPDGGIYVGTSPDGKIYKLDRDGHEKAFYAPPEKYIWALAVDPNKGTVYAATGDKGVIYRITPEGQATPFYRTRTTHAMALALDSTGNLLVGTGSPGKVIRVDPDGKGFVLLDSPFQEIRTLRFDDKGVLFATAMSGGPAPRGGSSTVTDVPADRPTDAGRPLTPTVTAEITSVTVVESSPTPSAPARGARPASRGAVYRIAPDGVWDQLWESREDSPYDIAFDARGAVIVATGNKGKLYRLEGDPLRPTLLARASAQQITSLFKDRGGRVYYATANPGKLFRLSSETAMRGTYESEAFDARTVATWGSISWRGAAPAGSRVELFTRAGNTELPDDTWSSWSTVYSAADGSPIGSPKARYLQWRAVLTRTAGTPVVTSIAAAYLQRNLRPQVRTITVYPHGIVFLKPFSSGEPDLAGFENQSTPDRRLAAAAAAPQSSSGGTNLGRRTFQKGLQTLAWRADDENDDDLVYDVLFRREGETEWRPLRRAIPDTIMVWDTTTVPNGTYFVKIVASDSPSNPAASALGGDLDSTAFQIDNTPPDIIVGNVRTDGNRTLIVFDVKDDHSPIQKVEFSQDGQRWRSVFPVDGIADTRQEHYELAIDGELSERGLTLRASDTMDNLASVHVDRPRR